MKAYMEDLWIQLDGGSLDIAISMELLGIQKYAYRLLGYTNIPGGSRPPWWFLGLNNLHAYNNLDA